MPKEKAHNAKKIIYRIRNAYNMDSDTKLAAFLGVAPSTISTWKRRNSIDYDLIFAKCEDLNANYLIYGDSRMFRDQNDPRNIKSPPGEEPAPQANEEPANYSLAEAKKKAAQFVRMIENLPWPVETRREILQSYLRIVDEELRSVQEHQKSDPNVDD